MNKTVESIEKYLQEFASIADDWFKEQTWMQERFDFYINFFKESNLKKADWSYFQELGNHIHSFKTMGIARSNALGNPNLPVEEYRRIFSYIKSEIDPINVTINNLYKKYEGNAVLPFFSDSSVSELIAYAFPNKYVVYNRRDVKALEILGINVPKVRAEKFGDTFRRYNEILAPVLKQYKKIVGQRTNTTIQLEVDQFFSWLYETKKADKPIKELINRYKNLIRSKGLEKEKYKWEFIRDFKGKPDLNGNLEDEIKAIKFSNLIYHLSISCLAGMANFDAPALRKEFEALRNETIDLDKRISDFSKKTLKLYKKSGGQNSHHQDERSMSVYLTLTDPSEYTFYKNSYYKEYCALLGAKVGKPKQKYSHYLELIKDLAENFISKDEELMELLQNELGELIEQDPSYLLAAQDILYQMLNSENDVNYWIFQGNPKTFDFETALRQGTLNAWKVSAHKDKIKDRDKVIFWITGDQAGVYALAEITAYPEKKKSSTNDDLWKVEDNSDLRAELEITHNLIDNPVLKEYFEGVEELKKFKGGSQGTNFSSTKEEYQSILELVEKKEVKQYWIYAPGENATKWEEFYDDGIMGLGWDELGDLTEYASRDEIKDALQKSYGGTGSKKNDVSANHDFVHKMKIGDIIIAKKGRGELLGYGVVTSDYKFDRSRSNYRHLRHIDWKLKGNWEVSFNLVLKTLTDISSYPSDDPEYTTYYEQLLGIMEQESKSTKTVDINTPLNTILYGPPGTGKTYYLKNKLFSKYTTKESSVTREELVKKLVGDLSWWKVIALVLAEMKAGKVNDIRDHEFLKVKEGLSNSSTVTQTIWGQLQAHTIEECSAVNVKQRMNPLIFFKEDDSNWRLDKSGYLQIEEEISAILDEINNFQKKNDLEIKRYEFITFHQSYAYEDFIEGIKPVMEDESGGDLHYEIKDGIFKKLCQRAANDMDNTYAIFIDEINRGNVSSIFGELITLIEADKRQGSKNEMTATLPYSRSSFGVPKNLHIYGTMNTADRSVEALDTALRRRFSFKEMLPNPSLLKETIDGIELKTLLEVINKRIEVLVDRDHTVGHAFFMDVHKLDDLRNVFANKVIPLLQEYFYGDYGKMEMVIGSAFFNVKDTSEVTFAVRSDDFDPEGKVYHIVDVADKETMPDDKFINALTKLIKGES